MRNRVAIIVEVKKREMPFMSILKGILQQKGYKVKLIPFRSLCTWRLLFFRPDVVVINGLRNVYPYFVGQIYIPKKLFKSKIICYYSEQVGYYDQSIASDYNNTTILNNVDYHISNGWHFAKDIVGLGVSKDKMWITGSVQYDIDKYLRRTSEDVKKELSATYNIPFNKRWILYADNIIEAYQPKGLFPSRRKETFNMIEAVALKNPECHIVFRPHPDTPYHEIDAAKQRFKDIENISVIGEGHIFDWTCSIAALIIWNSTSSIQTMFMGIPVLGYMTSDGLNMENYWYKDIFPTFTDIDKLANAVHGTLAGEEDAVDYSYKDQRDAYIEEWYFKKDGYSFDRLCQIIGCACRESFIPLTKDVNFGIGSVVKLLYYELRAWIGDIVKNRSLDKNIYRKEVQNELSKYDITRFEGKEFEIVPAEYGNYLL